MKPHTTNPQKEEREITAKHNREKESRLDQQESTDLLLKSTSPTPLNQTEGNRDRSVKNWERRAVRSNNESPTSDDEETKHHLYIS